MCFLRSIVVIVVPSRVLCSLAVIVSIIDIFAITATIASCSHVWLHQHEGARPVAPRARWRRPWRRALLVPPHRRWGAGSAAKARGAASAPAPRAARAATRDTDKRDTEDKALRALARRFPKEGHGFFCERVGGAGKTWLEVVAAEFLDASRGTQRLREKEWAKLEAAYSGSAAGAPPPPRAVEAARAHVRPALWAAMAKARTENITETSRADLSSVLGQTVSLNEHELNGVAAHMLSREHPAASRVSQRLGLAFLRALARATTPAPALAAWKPKLHDFFDEVLLTSWSALKKDRRTSPPSPP